METTLLTFVANISEGSSAVLAGLQLNDTIIEIDGQKIPVFNNLCDFIEWKSEKKAQNLLMVKTKRDDEVIRIEKGIIPRR